MYNYVQIHTRNEFKWRTLDYMRGIAMANILAMVRWQKLQVDGVEDHC